MNIYDEALKELKNFFNDEDWVWEMVLPKTFLLIERAKKEHELLGLYRKQSNLLWDEDFVSATPVEWKIDDLEKELGEMK